MKTLINFLKLIVLILEKALFTGIKKTKNHLVQEGSPQSTALEIDTKKLRQLSSKLLALDTEAYYLSLYKQLNELYEGQEGVFNKETSPLRFYRVNVDEDGLILIGANKEENLHYSDFELLKISMAIYQLAYACSLHNDNAKYVISKGITPLLMSPLVTIFKNSETIKMNALLRQLVFSMANKKNTSQVFNCENANAMVIQRAYRKKQYLEANKKGLVSTEEINKQLQESMDAHLIKINNPLPVKRSELTTQYKMQWASEAKGEYNVLAKRLVSSLVFYRSHEKFKNKLKYVVEQLNAHLQQLPKGERKYIIVVKQDCYAKSNHWCVGLALPYLQIKPAAILFPNEVSDFKEKNADLKHSVFIDDAAYSGRQLRDDINSLTIDSLNIIILLPYYSAHALSKFTSFSSHVSFIGGEKMFYPREFQNIKELWSLKESDQINALFDDEWSLPSSKAGVFFAHKVADSASTYLQGGGLSKLHSNEVDLIPDIMPPYRV